MKNVLVLDLDGFNKEDIKVRLENGFLIVSAEKKKKFYVKKSYYDTFIGDIRKEDIKVRLNDGMLTIEVESDKKIFNESYEFDNLFDGISNIFDEVSRLNDLENKISQMNRVARFKKIINDYVDYNSIEKITNYLFGFCNLDFNGRMNHALSKIDSFIVLPGTINLYYLKYAKDLDKYVNESDNMTKVSKSKVKDFVVESYLDNVIISLRKEGYNNSDITKVIASYLKNKSTNNTLLSRIDYKDIIHLMKRVNVTKVSKLVDRTNNIDYVYPNKVYKKEY